LERLCTGGGPTSPLWTLRRPRGGRWRFADGRTLTAGQHSFPGGGSITLPDGRNLYPLGADFAGTGITTGTPPAIGAIIGGHVLNLNHTHAVASHTHTVAAHSHTVAHSHNVLGHTHPIPNDIPNKFIDDLGNPQAVGTRTGATSGGSTFQSLYVPGATDQGGGSRSLVAATHNHGGNTSSGTGSTDVQTPATSSVALTTDATSPSTGNPSPDLSTTDNRPHSLGLALYIKVMY
jgi:hypothetical protein